MPFVSVKKEYGLVVLGGRGGGGGASGVCVNVSLQWASFLEAERSSSFGERFIRNGEGCYFKRIL